MKNEEYRSLLGQLPLKNPSPDDMARFCPHLSKKQAVKAFTKGSGFVACPPLRVRNGFQILSYKKEWVEEIKVWRDDTQVITGTKNHPPQLEWPFAGRTHASYADGKAHGDVFTKYKHTAEAIAFAEANWSEEIFLDDWDSVVTFYIQDPTDLVNDRYHKDYPRTKEVLYVTLNRDLNSLINDHSKPGSELFDDAISKITTDLTIWHELKGGRGEFTHFNCAYCSGGLSLTFCSNCKHKFKDDCFRCGWQTPLSRKMVTLLKEQGHIFKMDPEIAWKKERGDWEKYGKK